MDNNNAGTLLQRRRKSVKFSKEETLLILRAYVNHPTSWPEILDEVKQNIDALPQAARDVYTTGTLRQLRDRMSGKLSSLVKRTPEEIPDIEIRNAVDQIKRLERRLIPEQHQRPEQRPDPRPAQPIQRAAQAEAGPANDIREEMAGAQSTDTSDGEQPARRQPPARQRRQRKRPLAELIRENQECYNKFITKKVPKLMRMLGVSSSSDEN